MLCGLRQAIEIGREAFCLGAWRHTVGAHEQQLNTRSYARPPFFSRQYLLYNTVVLGGAILMPLVWCSSSDPLERPREVALICKTCCHSHHGKALSFHQQ